MTTKEKKKPSGGRTVFWWVAWITATIVSFFVAHMIWTPIIAEKFGSIRETKVAMIWVTAVFGTWIVILFPLIVVMYAKVDKAYEDARLNREKAEKRFRTLFVEPEKRALSEKIQSEIKTWPQAIDGGHLATVTLKDGRKFEHVYIQDAKEILGLYDQREFSFEGKDVASVEPTNLEDPPQYFMTNWLRLDGVSAPE